VQDDHAVIGPPVHRQSTAAALAVEALDTVVALDMILEPPHPFGERPR
jgi:hypothetical protein